MHTDASFSARMSPVSPPKRHHRVTKVPLAVSVAAFLSIVAVMIGALAASSMQRDDNMLRASLAQSQQDLLVRVARLEQSPCGIIPATKPVSNALPVSVTAQDLAGLNTAVDLSTWNTGAATETVEYKDKDRGISIRLPYNPAWGNATYKVVPVEVQGSKIFFGPLLVGAGTEFSRAYVISFEPKEDIEALSARYKSEYAASCSPGRVTQKDLPAGNLSGIVLSFPACQMAGAREEAVFSGKKLTYTFSRPLMTPLAQDDLTIFANIIRALKSI